MNSLPSERTTTPVYEASSTAETVLREGFARYEQFLQQAGIPSPVAPGANPILDFGTSFSQLLVLSFFDSKRQSMSGLAWETLSYDSGILKQGWEEFKAFIRRGGSELTQEGRLGAYDAKADGVYFDDKSALSLLTFGVMSYGLPCVEVYNWQAGSWDLTDLIESSDWTSQVEDRLQRLGYRQECTVHQSRSFIFYTHPDPQMATVLFDWMGYDELHLLVFYQSHPGHRIVLKREELITFQTPVIDLWANPQTMGLYDAGTGTGFI